MSDDERSKTEADQRTLFALSMILAVSFLLLGLMALVAPHLLGIILVFGGLLFLGGGNYLLWGWWLPKYLERFEDEDDAEKK